MTMKMTFINVGYGEAILLEWEKTAGLPEGFTVLIDGGSGEEQEYQDRSSGRIPVWEYIKQQKISQIDLMISTHIHEDHISGLVKAAQILPPKVLWQSLPPEFFGEMHSLDGFLVKTASQSKFKRALDDYRKLCILTRERGGQIRKLQAGQSLPLGPDAFAHVLAPTKEGAKTLTHSMKELYALDSGEAFLEKLTALDGQMNNYSLILMVECRGKRILLPGDTNREGYGHIPCNDLKADLFKVGHHGQRDGADRELLHIVGPEAVVCCASSDRRYDSAHPQLISLMEREGISRYFSDCPKLPKMQIVPHQRLVFQIEEGYELTGRYEL